MAKFNIKRKIAVFAVFSMLQQTFNVMGAETASDISGHWAEKTIAKWQKNGFIGGYEDGTFRPDKTVTRAEFVKLINKANNLSSKSNVKFSDISSSDWFYSDVLYAAGEGYISGFEDGSFR